MSEMQPENPLREETFFKSAPRAVLVKVLGVMRKTPERYYYDVEINGERKILSVGPTIFEIIQANRATDKFLFEKDGIFTRCRPL